MSATILCGSDYGGWWVPTADVKPDVVAYCAGAGEDITFDLALHVSRSRSSGPPNVPGVSHTSSQRTAKSRDGVRRSVMTQQPCGTRTVTTAS
jgi:hypothetical protein